MVPIYSVGYNPLPLLFNFFFFKFPPIWPVVPVGWCYVLLAWHASIVFGALPYFLNNKDI